jgi:hypothetical protein
MLEGAVAAIEPGRDVREMLHDGMCSIWSISQATVQEQHVLYELTQYALRNPGLQDLATWQYERYFEVGRDYLQAVADAAEIEWTAPLPVVARMLVSFFDGLVLGWLVDHNSDEASATLDGFIDGIALMARPRSEGHSTTAMRQRCT